MICFPHAKVNIGLHVVQKRTDGYHDIETLFVPIWDYTDALEIVPTAKASDKTHLQIEGLPIADDTTRNLCIKAWELLHAEFQIPPVQMFLYKNIPVGAGLGGGSSDGAFALLSLNELFNLNLDKKELIDYALQLGSDCPFFLHDQAMYGTERGNVLTPHSFSYHDYEWCIVSPHLPISTAEAYRNVSLGINESLFNYLEMPITRWHESVNNHFEKNLFSKHSRLAEIIKSLYDRGALFASLSGSGSSLFGIFPKGEQPKIPIKEGERFWCSFL